MSKFVNLHFNSEYSLLESSVTIDSYVSYAVKNNILILSLTDHNNMYGVDKFISLCNKNKIKPIIGVDLDVEDYRLVLIAKNYLGFQELSRLVSLKSKQKISLAEINDQNLFILDHPKFGTINKGNNILSTKDNFYFNSEDKDNPKAIVIKENKIMETNDNKTLEILYSLQNQKEIKFKEPGFINETKLDQLIVERTNKIASECNIEFPKINSLFPKFENELNMNSIEYLKKIITSSFAEKFKSFINQDFEVVKQRIKYELTIIEKLNVEDYFLIIWDFMKWGRQNDINFGPGRGSSAGSIICFLLEITEINPLNYGLLFERFLNPERTSMPDIDIDVQDDKRELLIKYIQNKYGKDHVAQIITFQRMTSKSAFRDVARALKIPNIEVNVISKLIPLDFSLKNAYEKNILFQAKINEKEIYGEAYNQALRIENLPRQRGTHAAGIIISQDVLINKIPIIYENEFLVSQFSMEYLESWGMLKIDLLGLKTLSTIISITNQIFQKTKIKINWQDVSLNDEKTNELLSLGNTIGIFQLESPGMINTLRKVHVNSFEDLVAIISLFRPGPMSNIAKYIKRKFKEEEIVLLHESYDDIVKSTYGIIVYQEQIMQIAQKFAGMNFGQADLLRRAISKKDKISMEKLKNLFMEGALSKGHSSELINKIYQEIEKFAEYGFNKSHAVAYATISYRMAYLKAWYPIEFYTAIISSLPGIETINKYIIEARRLSYEIISPEINLSQEKVYSQDNKIILPLIIIKGLGKIATEKILNDRLKNGKYLNFYNFVARAKVIKLGEAIIEILVKSNALRSFGNIQTLLLNLNQAKKYAECVIVTENDEIKIDYSLSSEQELIIEDRNMKDEIIYETQYLGAIYNAFPTINYETKDKLKNLSTNVEYKIVLFLEKIQDGKKDKNGREYGIITLSDSSGKEDVFVFAETWEKFKEIKVNSLMEFKIIKSSKQNNWKIRIVGWRVINEK